METNLFFSQHKLLVSSLLIILVPIFLIVIYSIGVITRASSDTPKVIAAATSPDRISLRLKDFSDE